VNENGTLQLVNRLEPKMTPLSINFLHYYHDMTLGQGGRRLLLKALGVKDKVRRHLIQI